MLSKIRVLLIFYVGNSKHDVDIASSGLLHLFIEFITGWLFEVVQKVFISEESALFIIRFIFTD